LDGNVKIVQHYFKEHRASIPNDYLIATYNNQREAYLQTKYGDKWNEKKPTQRFRYYTAGGSQLCSLRVSCPAAVVAENERAAMVLERLRQERLVGARAAAAPGPAGTVGGAGGDGPRGAIAGFIYKDITIVNSQNRFGGSANDEFIRDPRVINKFKSLIDLGVYTQLDAFQELSSIVGVIETGLVVMDALIALKLKTQRHLERTELWKRPKVLADTWIVYLKTFTKFVTLGLVVSNIERLVFTDVTIDVNERQRIKAIFGNLFELCPEVNNLLRQLFDTTRALAAHRDLPGWTTTRRHAEDVKAFTDHGISSERTLNSIQFMDSKVGLFHPMIELLYAIFHKELEVHIKGESHDELIVRPDEENVVAEDAAADAGALRELDIEDGEGEGDGDDDDDDEADPAHIEEDLARERDRHRVIPIVLNNFDAIEGPPPQANLDDADAEPQFKYPEVSNWVSVALLSRCIGTKEVRGARQRQGYLIEFSQSVTNVFWYHFLKHMDEGLQIPTLFAGFKIMVNGVMTDLKPPLPSGVTTVGSLALSWKREANRVVANSVARRVIRCRLNPLDMSVSIQRLENMNTFDNTNYKAKFTLTDFNDAVMRGYQHVSDALTDLFGVNTVNEIIGEDNNNLDHWLSSDPEALSPFNLDVAWIHQMIDRVRAAPDFTFQKFAAKHERLMLTFFSSLLLSNGPNMFRCSELYNSSCVPSTEFHLDGFLPILALSEFGLVNTRAKSPRQRMIVGYQIMFYKSPKVIVAIYCVAMRVYFGLLGEHLVNVVGVPRREATKTISDLQQRLVSFGTLGVVNSDAFRRKLLPYLYRQLELNAQGGAILEIRQLCIQLNSCLNSTSVSERVRELRGEIVHHHTQATEGAYYLHMTGRDNGVDASILTACYESVTRFRILIANFINVMGEGPFPMRDLMRRVFVGEGGGQVEGQVEEQVGDQVEEQAEEQAEGQVDSDSSGGDSSDSSDGSDPEDTEDRLRAMRLFIENHHRLARERNLQLRVQVQPQLQAPVSPSSADDDEFGNQTAIIVLETDDDDDDDDDGGDEAMDGIVVKGERGVQNGLDDEVECINLLSDDEVDHTTGRIFSGGISSDLDTSLIASDGPSPVALKRGRKRDFSEVIELY
jgi:hypothetical protein